MICCTQYLKRIAVRAYSYKNVRHSSHSVILGIETSCDDTGCAVINTAGSILGESLYSQTIVHTRYGGVNPVVAHELHRNNIDSAVTDALRNAGKDIKDIDAIAVTTRPGLLLSLQVGVKYARYLCKMHKKPLIPIHHMEAHALVARMYHKLQFPYIVLLISGGHCLLALVKDVNNFELLGKSLDNAPGEIFDKVARRMKLRNIPEYSKICGGRAIELAAQKCVNLNQFEFPLPLAKHRDCNFSFSGLKDSLIRKLEEREKKHNVMGDELIPEVHDLCAAFQLAVAEHIAHRTHRAMLYCEKYKLTDPDNRVIVVSGGVACNNFIFKSIEHVGSEMGYQTYRPPHNVCTDNGVMIAWNGVEKLRKQIDIRTDFSLKEVQPEAPLGVSLLDKVETANIKTRVTRLKKLYT
ncbi:unnamed protein product [Spodoptera exigua]|nr:unnamed protein product [Spodoptera exigua]